MRRTLYLLRPRGPQARRLLGTARQPRRSPSPPAALACNPPVALSGQTDGAAGASLHRLVHLALVDLLHPLHRVDLLQRLVVAHPQNPREAQREAAGVAAAAHNVV